MRVLGGSQAGGRKENRHSLPFGRRRACRTGEGGDGGQEVGPRACSVREPGPSPLGAGVAEVAGPQGHPSFDLV